MTASSERGDQDIDGRNSQLRLLALPLGRGGVRADKPERRRDTAQGTRRTQDERGRPPPRNPRGRPRLRSPPRGARVRRTPIALQPCLLHLQGGGGLKGRARISRGATRRPRTGGVWRGISNRHEIQPSRRRRRPRPATPHAAPRDFQSIPGSARGLRQAALQSGGEHPSTRKVNPSCRAFSHRPESQT